MIKKLLITYLFLITNVFAGLPPTTSKINGESSYLPTFKTDFGTFKGTRSGSTLILNSIGDAKGDSLVLGGTKDTSAILDVQSTNKGALLPRMTTAQRDLIPLPSTGLIIYNTDTNKLEIYDSGSWVEVGGGSPTTFNATLSNGLLYPIWDFTYLCCIS